MQDDTMAEMQYQAPQNANPPPLQPAEAYSHRLYATNYSSHYPLNPNPHPQVQVGPIKTQEPHYSIGLEQGLRPPGVDAYASGACGAYDPGAAYAYRQAADAAAAAVPSGYYQDPNVISAALNWVATEVVSHYGSIPYATGVTVPPSGTEQLVNPKLWTNAILGRHGNGTWKRPKKTKIVQSAWCEVCKVDCNSKEVLDQHKLGKKHKKNLEKLKQAIAPPPVASVVSNNPVIGPQENPNKGKAAGGARRNRKKSAESAEDLEAKRRKILEGGAAADAVRICTICNVICNSEVVFSYHLAGQKHAAVAKKHAGGAAGVAAATTTTTT